MVDFSSELSVVCPSTRVRSLCEDAGNTLIMTARSCGAKAVCNLLLPITPGRWESQPRRGCSASNAGNEDPGTEDTKQEPNIPSSHLVRGNLLRFPTDSCVFVCKYIWVPDILQNIFLCKDHNKDKGCKTKLRDHSELSDLAKAGKY